MFLVSPLLCSRPLTSQTGEKAEVEDFNAWLGALPHTHKIVIAGNHEITFDTSAYHSIWRRYHKMKVRW